MAITPVAQITNLGELKSAVGNLLNRDDMDTEIALFPELVRSELNRMVLNIDGTQERFRHWRMILIDTLDVESGNALVALPSTTATPTAQSGDWLETVTVSWDTYKAVYKSPDFIAASERNYQNATEPALTVQDPYFTYRGANFELWPTPTADGSLSVEYYAKIPALSGDGSTNWLLDHAPDVYLYGCAKHAAPHLRDDPRIPVWDTLYRDAVMSLHLEGKVSRTSGSRMTRPAMAVI